MQILTVRAPAAPRQMSDEIADWLVCSGVTHAFGVSGGGVAYLWGALCRHPGLRVLHTQHESGAAFAAAEASLASGAPVAVFTTTGPGLTNAITGLIAARSEGARLIVLSGATPAKRRGRDAVQETHAGGPVPDLFVSGPIFDEAALVEGPEMLAAALHRVGEGLSRPGGFVAHLGVPTDVQSAPAIKAPVASSRRLGGSVSDADLDALTAELADRRVAVVVGFEARDAAPGVRALAERLGALTVCTPRGKGILSERHPLCAGVIGFAGGEETLAALSTDVPDVLLCLGARLGESSSQWSDALRPRQRIVQVHPSVERMGGCFPDVPLLTVQAPVRDVVDGLLARLRPTDQPAVQRARPSPSVAGRNDGLVRPSALLAAMQEVVVDGSDALVMAESGNSFAWAISRLAFATPRLRVSVRWGSMGHFAAGAIGPAAVLDRRTVALVGDGAMLMNQEVATAVRHGLPAVWVVLNDHGYTMCRQGTAAQDIRGVDCDLAPVDFAAWAAALGARGLRVDREEQLHETLRRALSTRGPCVVDVRIDPTEPAPIGRRVRALTWHDRDADA